MAFDKKKTRKPRGRKDKQPKEYDERLLEIRRVTRVTTGGRRMSFRATMLIGNGKWKIGIGTAKGPDVAVAVRKASREAYKNIVLVPITENRSVPYPLTVKNKAAVIKLIPAASGTGLKAGSSLRSVLELAGYENILSKIVGANNKLNVALTTFKALQTYKHADHFAAAPTTTKKEESAAENKKADKKDTTTGSKKTESSVAAVANTTSKATEKKAVSKKETAKEKTPKTTTKKLSKTDEKILFYKEESKKLWLDLSDDLIEKATKACGPSIHRADAELVSSSSDDELATVKKNFIAGKLWVEGEEADKAIQKAIDAMGSANKNKYRALFYALVAKELGKEDALA